MRKNLIKIATGIGAATYALYLGAFSVLAAGPETVNLCATQQGFNIAFLCDTTLGGLIKTTLNTVLFVAFVIALVFLIIGGIRWIMSAGDKEGAGKAKETVTSALIGLAIVIGSWILINIVLTFFGIGGGLSGLTSPVLQQK